MATISELAQWVDGRCRIALMRGTERATVEISPSDNGEVLWLYYEKNVGVGRSLSARAVLASQLQGHLDSGWLPDPQNPYG